MKFIKKIFCVKVKKIWTWFFCFPKLNRLGQFSSDICSGVTVDVSTVYLYAVIHSSLVVDTSTVYIYCI